MKVGLIINLQAYWSTEMYSISNPLFMQLYILPSILFIIGLVSIIILSCIKSEPESIRDNHYGSINVVFKLFIAQVIFSVITAILIFTAPTFKIFDIPCIILIAASYIITFLYLITKRAIDAMIPGYIPILVVIGVSIIAGGYFYIAKTYPLSLSIFTLSIPSIFMLLFRILNLSYLILIVLPSKRKDLDDEHYFE